MLSLLLVISTLVMYMYCFISWKVELLVQVQYNLLCFALSVIIPIHRIYLFFKDSFLTENVTWLSTEAILEGLASELRRIVEEREAKSVPASKEELDALDLKLRSLRTQLRKAEENSNTLAKQKRELEEKMKKNTNDVSFYNPATTFYHIFDFWNKSLSLLLKLEQLL